MLSFAMLCLPFLVVVTNIIDMINYSAENLDHNNENSSPISLTLHKACVERVHFVFVYPPGDRFDQHVTWEELQWYMGNPNIINFCKQHYCYNLIKFVFLFYTK